ncbi:MAG: glycosyltransferase family 4 protein [Caulobacteraceae bacterium]
MSATIVDTPARIGVDGYNLALAAGTGVASYGRSLCATLSYMGHPLDLVYGLQVSPQSEVALRECLFYARLGDDPAPLKPSFRRSVRRAFTSPLVRDLVHVPRNGQVIAPELKGRVPGSHRLFTRGAIFTASENYFRRYHRFMPLRLPNPPAIMHWTYPLPIRIVGAANIYTVHDLVPLRLPHTSAEDKSYYHSLLRACISDGDHIVTVSETSRRDIVSMLDVPEHRITNTFQAVDASPDYMSAEDRAAWLQRLFGLEADGYFLFYGAIEPKKNIGRLIEAYLEAGAKLPLVIVGREGWRAANELRLLAGAHGRRLDGADAIRRIDHLPRDMLLRLVQGARGVVFPSLYEGFGLPAAEAMALGKPVLTSALGATAEIVGDAALTVDPYDVSAIASGLQALDRDPGLRARLSAAGPARAARFSIPRQAERLDALYSAVLAQDPAVIAAQ